MSIISKVTIVAIGVVGATFGARSELIEQDWSDGPLTVDSGHIVHLALPNCTNWAETANASALELHGDMQVSLAQKGNYFVYYFQGGLPSTAKRVTVNLAPSAGDTGNLTLNKTSIYSFTGTSMYANLVWGGANGGGCGKLTLNDSPDSRMYTATLEAGAETDGDVFDILEMTGSSMLNLQYLYNNNSKPARISFNGPDCKLWPFGFGRAFLNLPNGGDVIFASGSAQAPITLITGSYYPLFSSDSTGKLRTVGAGALVLTTNRSKVPTTLGQYYLDLNKPNVIWGHAGDTVISNYLEVVTSVPDVLPYGAQTGGVVVDGTQTGGNGNAAFIDLAGNSQHVNGLRLVGDGYVTNSGEPAALIFGDEDADGTISGSFGADKISYAKKGNGTLTLTGAELPNMTVTGGKLCVSSASSIGVLAMTNAVLEFAGNDSSLLTVADWRMGEGVTIVLEDGAATNCVKVSMPVAPGATLVKSGNNYVTYLTPDDAKGANLEVRAGVLRMGGSVCKNDYWRFIAKKATMDVRVTEENGHSLISYLYLGKIGTFTPEGVSCIGVAADVNPGESLGKGKALASKPYLSWNKEIGKAYFETDKDPILSGGEARGPSCFVSAWKDVENVLYDSAQQFDQWSRGMVFTNAMLKADDPDTWEVVTWRRKDAWSDTATSYSLARVVNTSRVKAPHVSDWELQSSSDGVSWETMDERTGQYPWEQNDEGYAAQLSADKCYSYNNHVPYLFSSKNANWKFNTFGVVQVDSGAVLELSELRTENISIGKLKVDLATGGGTITKFVPATDGVLYLENVPDSLLDAPGVLRRKCCVPLSLDVAEGQDRFATWSVFANGTKCENSKVSFRDGKLWVSSGRGLVLMVE